MMTLMLTLHLFSALIWVGGMFFAYVVLRPAAASQLQPPERLGLWVSVFSKFFPWVFASIVVLLASGYWMVLSFYGGFDAVGNHVHLMIWSGYLMMLIFLHVFFRTLQAPETGRRSGRLADRRALPCADTGVDRDQPVNRCNYCGDSLGRALPAELIALQTT